MATKPIASVKRLEELKLDKSTYGSCSEPDQRNIPNRGRVWINRGCNEYFVCPWKNTTKYQAEGDDPRPRNVATRFIKPNERGPGDIVINGWSPCFQFLTGKHKRDGKNNEIAEVVGGEGDEIRVKTSKINIKADKSVYYSPTSAKIKVPKFKDPIEDDELFEDIEATHARDDYRKRTVDSQRERRLGGMTEDTEAPVIVEVAPNDEQVQKAKANVRGH